MDKAFDQALTHSGVDTIRSSGAEWSCLGLQKFRHKRSAMYDQPVKRHGDVSVKMTFYGRPCWSSCHTMDSPPSKVVPQDCPRQNNRSPPTKYRSHTWSPLAADGPPPAADCSLFAIAFATTLAYGEQPGHCLFDQNKVRQHQLKSLQEGEYLTVSYCALSNLIYK